MITLMKRAVSTTAKQRLVSSVFVVVAILFCSSAWVAEDKLNIKLVSEDKNYVESISEAFYKETGLERSENIFPPGIVSKYIGIVTISSDVEHIQKRGFKLFDTAFNLVAEIPSDAEIPWRNGVRIGSPVFSWFVASDGGEILVLGCGDDPGTIHQILVFEKTDKVYKWKSNIYFKGAPNVLCDGMRKRLYFSGQRENSKSYEVLCTDLEGQVIWCKPMESSCGLKRLNSSKDFSVFQCTFGRDNPIGFGFELFDKNGKKTFSDILPGGRPASSVSPDGSFALFVVNDDLFIYDIQQGYAKKEIHFKTESTWEHRTRIIDCAVSSDSETIAVMRYINGGQEYHLIILNREGEKLGESIITGGESLAFDGTSSIIVRKHYQQQRRYELEK